MAEEYRPDPKFRDPFTIDSVVAFLDKVPFSLPFLALIPAAIGIYSEHVRGVKLYPQGGTDALLNLGAWRQVITTDVLKQYAVPLWMMGFIVVKSINRALTRYVMNNGAYAGDKPNWDEEVCVVTGGANGIGKEMAVLLAEKSKKKVAVLDLSDMSYSHPNITYYKLDVTNEAMFEEVANKIKKDIGEPTILINNAGIAIGFKIVDTPSAAMHKLIAINNFAHLYAAKLFVPAMIRKNHGHIVTVASSASYMALPNISSYAMSKAAALAFHEVLKAELRARHKAYKVRTTICCPTKVATMMGRNMADHPSEFFTPTLLPETVARAVVGSIEKGLSEHHMMPGYAAILPILRGLPAWIKRLVEVIGHTDKTISDTADEEGRKFGYAYDIERKPDAAKPKKK